MTETTTTSDVESLVQCLRSLDGVEHGKSTAITERALNLIFNIGGQKLTDQDKAKLSPVLKDAVNKIRTNIESAACRYRTRLESNILRKRSSIQFLIDEFGTADDPADGDSSLPAALKESVLILDKIISDYKDEADSDEGSSDLEEAGSKRVPSSHTWWKK